MSELITLMNFARRMGISHTSVMKAVNADRIDAVDKSGKLWFDWDIEMPKFVRTSRDPKVLKRYGAFAANSEDESARDVASGKRLRRTASGSPSSGNELMEKPVEDMDIVEAQQLTAIMKAKRAQLDYQQAKGQLVELKLVMSLYMDIGEKVKSSVMSLPDRLCPMFEGMKAEEMHLTMSTELKHALSSLSDDIERTIAKESREV